MLLVVDEVAIAAPEHPLIVVNFNAGEEKEAFRTLPRLVQGIENNLH